jgi:NSS family neurotransmitter:Na+ symporter
VFVLACLIFGAPVLVGEILIGRWSRRVHRLRPGPLQRASDIPTSGTSSAGPARRSSTATYYTMIAGWVMAYTWFFLSGSYATGGVVPVVNKFTRFVADSRAVSLWQLAFIALVTVISVRGVNRGVEWINRLRAPALLAILLILAGYSLATGDVARGLHFAFAPDLSRLTPAVILGAVGQAVRTRYQCWHHDRLWRVHGRRRILRRNVIAVVGSIFVVSLLATVIIFPLVFAMG